MSTDATAPLPERVGSWHPESELVDYSAAGARAAVEEAGLRVLKSFLDYLFDAAPRRVVADESYEEARARYFPEGVTSPPQTGRRLGEVLDEWDASQAPFQFNFVHPGALAYFTGPPLLSSVFGELLTQITNQSVDVWKTGPTAAFVDEEVIGWLLAVTGIPKSGFGTFTSGGVMANLIGLLMAREAGGAPRSSALLRQTPLHRCTVYASDQAHFSVRRSLAILGFPTEALRIVSTDESMRLRGGPLREAVVADLTSGLTPIAVVATAGTTNCGVIDSLSEVADVAADYDLWLHVDAAYGGGLCFSNSGRSSLEGMGRADSLTIDPHKWLFQSHDIGALLTPHRDLLQSVFSDRPEYYVAGDHDEPLHWYQWGVEGTRRCRGLKLWMSWKHLGTDGLGKLVDYGREMARQLASRLDAAGDFEVYPSPPELSVVTFRHSPAGVPERALDRYQLALQQRLESGGHVWVSVTKLRGRPFLRAGLLNYFTSMDTLDDLIRLCRSKSAEAISEAVRIDQSA